MDNPQLRIEQFDQVKLRTTKGVSYLSAPPGAEVVPQGIWSVVAAVNGNELILAKNNAIIKAPADDVLVVSAYNLESLSSVLGKLSHGQTKEVDTDSQGRA